MRAVLPSLFLMFTSALAVNNDTACKDVSRLCYVSSDPVLYSNPAAAPFPGAAQGHQGRLVSVRRQLLPALPARRPPTSDGRYGYEPYRISLHNPHSTGENVIVNDGGTHYARNGSVRLAYRVLGHGDTTLVWNPGWFSNVDVWTDPSLPFATFTEALARGTRLVLWDKRGTGLSDPVTHVPPLDERMDDLHAVMDAVGVDTAAFFGVSE